MGAAYAIAAFPEPYRILGLKLRPFCLGHYFILQRFENAFVAEGDAIATRSDLIFAVLVCSMTPAGFMEFLDDPSWSRQVKAWGKKAGLFDLTEKTKLFQEYLHEAQKMPEVWFEKEAEGTSGSHWSAHLQSALLHRGFTQEQAINLPLSQAWHEFYKAAEEAGFVRFMSDDELEMARQIEPNGSQP